MRVVALSNEICYDFLVCDPDLNSFSINRERVSVEKMGYRTFKSSNLTKAESCSWRTLVGCLFFFVIHKKQLMQLIVFLAEKSNITNCLFNFNDIIA